MRRFIRKGAAALLSAALVLTSVQIGKDISDAPTASAATSNLLAFPGAVGGGKYATGGRGGTVYHVTNLNDSGAGSLRDAVSQPNRIVVFDVSGTITLSSNIVCSSNITIAGQTAPGGSGVTLKDYKFGMGGDNVIVRYLSSRPGPDKSTSSGNDAWGGAKGSNSIIDHCSMGWTTDEQWGLYSNNDHYTVQYSVIGPANSWGGHVKGVHGFGLMMGRSNLTFDHNLIIHNVSRNFRGKVVGTETADFTNNIIYDWGYQTAYGTIGHVNYVNNTLKAGNSTSGGYHYVEVSSSDNFKIYMNGNRIINKDGSVRNAENNNWSAMSYKHSDKNQSNTESADHFTIMQDGEDLSTALTCESASASYDHVISYAGNGISSDKRTKIDKQCADETKNGTGQCSGTEAYDSSQSGLSKYNIKCGVTYEYPSAVTKKEITDNDNDGMDDDWELARGLNPSDPSDYSGDYCGQGYMNIEYYINDLTVDSFPAGVVETSPESKIDPISAFDYIEAENYAVQSGVRAEDMTGGGQDVGYIENGDYIGFRYVDFADGAKSFTANLAGNAADIEIYIDKPEGTPVSVCKFDGTGGWQNWQEVSFNIGEIKDVHNVYLVFKSSNEGYLLNIDKFKFGKNAIPINGRLIKNLQVFDSARIGSWKLADNTAEGSSIYGDRAFTLTAFPSKLTGCERIMTACDSKNFTDKKAASFTAAADIDVYTAVDVRVEQTPSWLVDWSTTDFGMTSSNDVNFKVFKRSFKSNDTVELGANEQSYQCINYAVFVIETQKETVPTEPPTEPITEPPTTQPPTEPPTEQPTPAAVMGDVNNDGVLDSRDIITITNYLLKKAALTEGQWSLADLDNNGKINIVDLLIVKRKLR